jgi:hypothetical protein
MLKAHPGVMDDYYGTVKDRPVELILESQKVTMITFERKRLTWRHGGSWWSQRIHSGVLEFHLGVTAAHYGVIEAHDAVIEA